MMKPGIKSQVGVEMPIFKKLFHSVIQEHRRPLRDPEAFKQLQAEFMRHYGQLTRAAIESASLSQAEIDELAEKALRAADRMIEMEPQRGVPWTCRCLALSALFRFSEALEANNQAIEIDPSDPEKWDLQASILQALGRTNDAREATKVATDLRARTATT